MGRRGAMLAAALAGLAVVALPARGDVSGFGLPMHVFLGPTTLPAGRLTPVTLQLGTKLESASRPSQPTTTELGIALSARIVISDEGLQSCGAGALAKLGLGQARKQCDGALVGHGNMTFTAFDAGNEGSELGHLLIFNHREHGRPGLLAQIEMEGSPGTRSRSFTIGFAGSKTSPASGESLVARLPQALAGNVRKLVSFDLSLRRVYRTGGRRQSFLSASCPAPRGVIERFKVLSLTIGFADGSQISETSEEACRSNF